MPKSVFQDIYTDLKGAIEDGTFPYQSYLPTEHELSEHYGCSRTTVRRALSSLAAQGYVLPQRGRGVRVIRDPAADISGGLEGLETMEEIAERRGSTLVTKVTAFELVTADEHLSALTGFPVGSDLTRAKRVRYMDGVAVSTDDSYYLSSSVPGLTPQIAEGSIYRYLEQSLGVKIGLCKRDVTIEHPTPEDARCMDLGDFNAIGVLRGKTYRIDGTLMEYTETRQVPAFFSLRETVVRTGTLQG